MGPLSNAFFIAASLGAVAVLISLLRSATWRRTRMSDAAVGMILGAAAGNLYDRIVHQAVRDFLDFHWRRYAYPTFNLADSLICVGTVLLAWHLMRSDPGKSRSPSGSVASR